MSMAMQGIVLAVAGQVFFSGSLTIVKALAGAIPAIQIAWLGFSFSLIVLAVICRWRGVALLPRGSFWLHGARGLMGFASLALVLFALQRLPMPDVISISFAQVLFLTVIAALALGETVRWRRWTAVAIGFAGVVVMMRPGTGALEGGAIWLYLAAVAGAAFGAAAVAVMKHLTRNDNPLTLALSFAITAALFGAPLSLLVWQTPTALEWVLILASGLLNIAGQQCFIHAYARADASLLAPFDYSRLVFAGVLAALFFAEYPDIWTLSGAAIIIASTLYIARREARLAKQRRQAQAAQSAASAPASG